MEQIETVLCDTDVLIEFYRNNNKIIDQLRKIGQQNIAISIISAGELIFGALNKKELTQIKKDIKYLVLKAIEQKTCEIFLEIMSKYALSHKVTVPDAFIAATALSNEIELFTLNLKDFSFIDGLKIYHGFSATEK